VKRMIHRMSHQMKMMKMILIHFVPRVEMRVQNQMRTYQRIKIKQNQKSENNQQSTSPSPSNKIQEKNSYTKDAGSGMFEFLLSSLYSQVSNQLKILPGSEFRAAFEEAKNLGCPVVLGDRSVGITISRTWNALTLFERISFVIYIILSFSFEINANDIERIKDSDVVTEMIRELGEEFPSMVRPLLYERDEYLAATLRLCPGPRVVGVVGLGHVEGIKKNWNNQIDIKALEEVKYEPRWRRNVFISSLIAIPFLFLFALYLLYAYLPFPFPLFAFLFLSICLIYNIVIGWRASDLIDQFEKEKRSKVKNIQI